VRSPARGRSERGQTPNNEQMTAAGLDIAQETEVERVEHWRAEELVRAGYDPSDAIALASRHDIDLHLAVALIQQGCPYETAIEILI